MFDLFREIAIQQLLAPILLSLSAAIATAIVGWIGLLYTRVTGEKMDQKNQQSLQSALTNGMNYGIQWFIANHGRMPNLLDTTERSKVMEMGMDYVKTSVPGAVKHFSLDDWNIGKLLLPKMPVPGAIASSLSKVTIRMPEDITRAE